MNVKHMSYFAFDVEAFVSCEERLPLVFDNIEVLVRQLEDGGNIFEVIPELEKGWFDKSRIKYGLFEKREEIDVDGERFVSNEGYKQVGKLLIPHYRTISRRKISSIARDSGSHHIDAAKCIRALDEFPGVDVFYNKSGGFYLPFDENKVLVLKEGQL